MSTDLEFWINLGQKAKHESILGNCIDDTRKRNHGSQQTKSQVYNYNFDICAAHFAMDIYGEYSILYLAARPNREPILIVFAAMSQPICSNAYTSGILGS